MVKKGFLKKTGCILISVSVILTGLTFFGSTTSEAEYSGGNYIVDGGTITATTLSDHKSELSYISSTGNLAIEGSALQEYDALENVIVTGTLSLGSYSLAGNGALNSVVCTTMSGADATTFAGCSGININITGQTAGSGYYMSGGALYNGSTLVYVPASAGESVTVRSGTTAVSAGAFNDSIVTALYFQNKDADKITSFGNQSGWPSDEMICYCYGGSTETSASAVATFFTRDCENAGANKVQYDSGSSGGGSTDPTTEYTVTVVEKFYQKDGTTEVKTNTSTKTFTTGTTNTITPATYDNYELTDGTATSVTDTTTVTFKYKATTTDPVDPTVTKYTVEVTEEFYDANDKKTSSAKSTLSGEYAANSTITAKTFSGYTVTGNASVVFKYKVSSSTDSSTKYTVTVYDEFYKSNMSTLTKRTIRSVAKYSAGSKYSYSPTSYTGYSHWGGRNESGTVNSDVNVYFFYKEKDGSSSSSSTTKKNTTADTTGIYKITEGANQKVPQNGGPLKIVCNGPMEKLLRVMMDGKDIPEGSYTLESGSVILTLTYNYVQSLEVGNHIVRFEYIDGYSETNLTITGKSTTTVTYKVSSDGSISSGHTKDTTPKTADGFDARYLLCLAIFLLGAGAILMGRQRKLEAILANRSDD